MLVEWKQVQEDFKKKDDRITELEGELILLRMWKELAINAIPSIEDDIKNKIKQSPISN